MLNLWVLRMLRVLLVLRDARHAPCAISIPAEHYRGGGAVVVVVVGCGAGVETVIVALALFAAAAAFADAAKSALPARCSLSMSHAIVPSAVTTAR